MGNAVSETKNAPELISSIMNEVATSTFIKNSVEDTNTNTLRGSCSEAVIENINSTCLESLAAKRHSANEVLLNLIKLNVPYNDAVKSANKILDMENPACNKDLCNFKDITQKITRSITVNDNTASNMAAAMQSQVDQKVDQIVNPTIEAGIADAKTMNDLGTKIKNTINNKITSSSVIETLRKFSNSNTIDVSNVGIANIHQEVAGTAYASSITNSIMTNNSDVIAEMQAAMDLSPKLSTMKISIGGIFAIIGIIVIIIVSLIAYSFLKTQKNVSDFARENPELVKMMMSTAGGPAAMAAAAAT